MSIYSNKLQYILSINLISIRNVEKKQAQDGVICVKPHHDLITDLITNLTAVSASPRSGILNQLVWKYLINPSEAISLIRPPAFP